MGTASREDIVRVGGRHVEGVEKGGGWGRVM